MSASIRRRIAKLCLVAAGLVLATQAGAQVMPGDAGDLRSLSVASPRLEQDHATADLAQARLDLRATADSGLDAFMAAAGGTWVGQVDQRTGNVAYVEGSGLPWFPGRGNSLRLQDVAKYLGSSSTPDLAAYDRKAREFAPLVAGMLGFDPAALHLNLGRSGAPAPHVWFVDYDVLVGGRPIEGARVVFVVNNGNLISAGTENLPAAGTPAPRLVYSAEKALDVVAKHIGGFYLDETWVDTGSYHLLPALVGDARFDAGYAPGNGRGVLGVWQFVFRRAGEMGTWRARVDAETGELVEFGDINEYGAVTGGAYKGDRPAAETVMPMPFANYATNQYANSAGLFSGTTGTTTLSGQYVGISDSCGSISKSADANGLIAMGSSSGTDCTTPGSGGSGNTHAARTQYYMVNRAKEVGRGWLPTNSWLSAKLTANVNLNQTCNAYWNGSTLNFFKSGGGCANTGELPGVSLHEWGHGLDTNDGSGSSADNGTGETYGDTSAFLATHNSCIGNGFLSSNCGGYGNACTSCTGVRDVDYAKHTSAVASTVDNFTRPNCPTSSNYKGPCGREGHCESLVSSQALWDLAARDLPGAGTGQAWTILDRLWYLSRSTATKAFQCTTTSTPWTSNGCFTGSYFRSMRAVDDDNGNLNDGTPHGAAIASAFNRHGLACTTDAGWNVTFAATTPPATPSLTATAGNNSVALSWSGSSGVYDVYRNESGCNAGFIKVANDVSTTSYSDSAVANGFTYYYQVTAQPSGNEAAASAPSTCRSVTPSGGTCTPPAAPTGVAASASSQTAVNVSWNASTGATSYAIYRSTTSGGGYSQVGTSTSTSFADTGLTCNTTYYYVVTASNGSCSSGNSAQASATTQACTGGTTAVYDATLKAPKCAAVVNSCDTGASLVLGRASLGPEPNQPNTINTTCADGTSGTFHSDESNDRVKVYTVDGTDFAAGKQVRVEATVWAWTTPSSDYLDLYYAADATNPTWTLIGTQSPTVAGSQVLSATYTLPSGSLQAVRAAFRYTGSASACASGSYNDRDDLVFAVGGGGGDTTPPTTSITAPANGATVSGTVSVTASASDNVGVTSVQFYIDGSLAGTDTTSPYSYSWDTTAVANGSHSIYSKAYDAAGNVGTSSTVTVTVSNSTGGNVLQNGVPVTNISGATGSQQFWTMDVPAGASNLVFQISGGSGDADLYVRFGADPTTTTYDCRPYLNGNNETCTFATPQTGTYHVMLNGYAAYSGVTLVGSFSTGGGGGELLTNGGFETAITPWVLSGNAYYTANGSYPHGGTGYAYLGNVNNANGNFYQQISIPSGGSPSLTFWLNVTSSETTTTTQYDKLYVEVTNTSGTVLSTLATFSNLNKTTAGNYSQKGPYSLAPWAGQTVRIRFRGTTDGSLVTTFRIDDASAQ
jgi:hypothetical protein